MYIPHIRTPGNITVVLNGKTQVMSKDSSLFDQVVEAVKEGRVDDLISLFDIKQKVVDFSDGKIKLVEGVLYYNETPIHSALSSRIVESFGEGFDIVPMCRFLERLYQNPDEDAINGLWGFLEASSLPITYEGNFIAYKMVGNNYKDLYTRTIDNSPGAIVTQPREEVEKNPNKTCSRGLHFASRYYIEQGNYGARSRGDRLMVVEIDPADVVSIPVDYRAAKGRCCKYKVLGEIEWDTEIPNGMVETSEPKPEETAPADRNESPTEEFVETTTEEVAPVTGFAKVRKHISDWFIKIGS
jgi:hypothetical protein